MIRITLILLFSSVIMYSQSIGGGVLLSSPQGEFRENVDKLGFGAWIQGTAWAPSTIKPFTIGINASYIMYGRTSENRPFSLTIPDVTVEVIRENSIATLQLLFVLSPFSGDLRPYAEAFGGGSYIFTTTSINSNNSYFEQITSDNNFDDFAWSFGYGAGLLIKLTDSTKPGTLYLDLKARYVYGTNTEYITETGVIINEGNVYYDVSNSRIDLLTFNIGVSYFIF